MANDEVISVETDKEPLSISDQRMLRAISSAQSARTGVTILQVLAAVVAVAAVVGSGLQVWAFGDDTSRYGDSLSGRQAWAIFLSSVATPLAFAGLVLASSFILAVYSSRLEMDIVLADEETD